MRWQPAGADGVRDGDRQLRESMPLDLLVDVLGSLEFPQCPLDRYFPHDRRAHHDEGIFCSDRLTGLEPEFRIVPHPPHEGMRVEEESHSVVAGAESLGDVRRKLIEVGSDPHATLPPTRLPRAGWFLVRNQLGDRVPCLGITISSPAAASRTSFES